MDHRPGNRQLSLDPWHFHLSHVAGRDQPPQRSLGSSRVQPSSVARGELDAGLGPDQP
ncbi:hypothetical protein [Mesorhizobium sp. WSM3859]|uniref:hypothetical protein n=1 Tax=Mesorhizobium sp. WSM3859 TaxID=2029402 RepID=UPI001596C4FF|nr:hypothetical protein [Mesorhizobium sp. WSM3859]